MQPPIVEHFTVAMPAETAATLQDAIAAGDYATPGEVLREALESWCSRRTAQLEEVASLRRDLDEALEDIAAGRVYDFDVEQIKAGGRQLLAERTRSV